MKLNVKNISFSFPGASGSVLSKVSFQVKGGESIGVVGKSGSGKTTLLRSIYGLYDLSKGEILFDGEQVRGPSKELVPGHPKMKLIAQHFDLLKDHTVEENILHHLLAYQSDFKRKKTDQLLRLTGLYPLRKNKPESLSGGQKQLLAIACALAEEPELLLLDEPFSHLDLLTKNEIFDYLKSVRSILGFTLIFVSHDAPDVLDICDRILVMEKGKIIEEGKPETLFFDPENEYTAALFGKYSVVGSKSRQRFIRPSRIHTCSAAKSRFTGAVSAIHFRGDITEIHVQKEKKGEMIFLSSSTDFRLGQTIHLTWE